MVSRFHPFDHIDEKLERAEKHIEDLDAAVAALLATMPYSSVPDNDPEALRNLNKLAAELRIPPRINILAGEAIHQTRSVLDHIASALVSANKGTITGATQFPIYAYRPSTPKDAERYEGQIRGMTYSAKAMIDALQPCNAPDRLDNPLTLLKHLDNIDKHQALLVSVAVTRPIVYFDHDGDRVSTDDPIDFFATHFGMNVEARFETFVVFPQFGTTENKPVVEAIAHLWAYVTFSVRSKFNVELTDFGFG